jgi:hypothetical protein
MIRRLNFTGRKSIPRWRVTVRVVPMPSGEQAFTVHYDLKGMRFPREARVYVESYNSDSYMRFDFGSVGEPAVPRDTRLTEITARPLAKFRLKIVDETEKTGLLLGVADKIIPLRPDEDLEQKQSLLPVDFRDLGERVWRLDLTDWPVLELNNRVDEIAEAARSSGSFLGLLYPEVLRRILHEAVIVHEVVDPEINDDDWTCLWLRFACAMPGIDPPPSAPGPQQLELLEDWIEAVVQAFCLARHARARLEAAVAKEFN